jgi:hypothetical protein
MLRKTGMCLGIPVIEMTGMVNMSPPKRAKTNSVVANSAILLLDKLDRHKHFGTESHCAT